MGKSFRDLKVVRYVPNHPSLRVIFFMAFTPDNIRFLGKVIAYRPPNHDRLDHCQSKPMGFPRAKLGSVARCEGHHSVPLRFRATVHTLS